MTPQAQRLVQLAEFPSTPDQAVTIILEFIDCLDEADTRDADDRREAHERARGKVADLIGVMSTRVSQVPQ